MVSFDLLLNLMKLAELFFCGWQDFAVSRLKPAGGESVSHVRITCIIYKLDQLVIAPNCSPSGLQLDGATFCDRFC